MGPPMCRPIEPVFHAYIHLNLTHYGNPGVSDALPPSITVHIPFVRRRSMTRISTIRMIRVRLHSEFPTTKIIL